MTETEKDMHAILSGNVRKYRRYYNLTQIALAKKAGVSTNFINDIESGKKWASLGTLVKIARIFDVHVYELIKPPGLLPDDLGGILKKYTENISAAVNNISQTLLETINDTKLNAEPPKEDS